jgi:hypothetical protein
MIADPEDFSRSFTRFWGVQDVAGLGGLLAEDADVITLTGRWCEGRKAAEATFNGEFAGALARARLVTGKGKLRPLGPGAAVLHQRFVLSGLIRADGRDMGRIAALLIAVLLARSDGWQAVSLQFSATES